VTVSEGAGIIQVEGAGRFERAVIETVQRVADEFGVRTSADVKVEDGGALEVVLTARLRSAFARFLAPASEKVWQWGNVRPDLPIRRRRTMMYVPGNSPNMLLRAHLFRPDALIFDLEDSVPLARKDEARALVREVLSFPNEDASCEFSVRINGMDTEFWLEDLKAVADAAAGNPRLTSVRLPKAETPEMVRQLDEILLQLELERDLEPGYFDVFCLLESAAAVRRAYDIASEPRVSGITIGGEDLAADLRTSRSPEGTELEWIRRMVLVAGRAAGVDVIDTAYPMVHDLDGLRVNAEAGRQLGFDGKSVLHPSQIPVVHEVYTPSPEELAKAKAVVSAAEEAERLGKGAVAVDGRMVDAPVVRRARRILDMAGEAGK
jgi:citrate lyase subunit beta/citryl-CoA lyase